MAAVDLDPSAPLCPCGTRGCDLYSQHSTAFVQPTRPRRKRNGRRTAKR